MGERRKGGSEGREREERGRREGRGSVGRGNGGGKPAKQVRVLCTSVSFPSFPVGAMTILSPGTQSTGC